jgi:alkylation response protein AidB-like acyl-CoA dehydrogenase
MPFAPVTLSPGQERLRTEVREFLASELPRGSYRAGLGMNADASPEFSRKLAERGWVGMTIPAQYGGHGLGPVERFIVVEELLAAGAPVGAREQVRRDGADGLWPLVSTGIAAQPAAEVPA